MLTAEIIPGRNVVKVDFSGALHVEDEQTLHDILQRAVDEHGKIRVLASIGAVDFGRFEPAAVWMDTKAAAFLTDIERIALVMEPGVLETISEYATKLIPGVELRTFEPTERGAAEAWLRG